MPIKVNQLTAPGQGRTAICWSYATSHVLNLGRVPRLLAERGWRVRCLHSFAEDAYVGERVDGIEYFFAVPFDALGRQRSEVYLSPMVGQDRNFPVGARRIHLLVSLDGIEGVYDPGHFDHYDVIAMAGEHHTAEFERHGRARGWTNKVLLPVGYPKLDSQRRRAEVTPLAPRGDVPTVVFAPTHAYYVNEQFSALARYGRALVGALLDCGMRVVFRPHPDSWRDQDRTVVEQIVGTNRAHPRFEVDRAHDYFDSYARADAIVTDVSGTGFTFAFTFGRPAVYFAPNEALEAGRTGIQFEDRERIGFLARTVADVVSYVQKALAERAELRAGIERFRDGLIFNPGTSEEYLAGWIASQCAPTA
jgi:hypothetical protein